MIDEMDIRRIRLSDITKEQFEEIVDLELNCGLEPFTPEMLAIDIDCEYTYACFDDGHIAGFITVSDEEGYFSEDLFIFNINVGERWRRRGLASKLIREALLIHEGCRTMSLDVTLTNEKALNLYKKLGFEPTGTPSMNGPTDIVMQIDRETLLNA